MVPNVNRLTNFPINSMTLFWITIISIIVQASLLPIDEDTDKRTGHNTIMRFGRQAGHNIIRFGRTPGHNIMRFGKREESNSSPGSSYEISESKPSLTDYPVHRLILDQLSSAGSSLISPSNNNLYNNYPSSNGYELSPVYGYDALTFNQRGQPAAPYQQTKKGRPETDHVIMRFG